MQRTRMMLADDHTLLTEAFRRLLENTFDIVGAVSNGRTLLETAPELTPEVILLDVGMPILNGLDAGRQLKEQMPGVKLIFLTMNEDPDVAIEAIAAGAAGYILKKCAASELFSAIRTVLKGGTYVTPQIARGMQEAFIRDPKAKSRPTILTPRQREVLQLLAEGQSMKQVGDSLNVSARTVAFHKYTMMANLGLHNNASLIQYAIKIHLVSP